MTLADLKSQYNLTAETIFRWYDSHMAESRLESFMNHLSDRLNLPESLDDYVMDYLINCKVDLDEALVILDEFTADIDGECIFADNLIYDLDLEDNALLYDVVDAESDEDLFTA